MQTIPEGKPVGLPANLPDVSATSLVTLYCRAIESQAAEPILHDEMAVQITRRLNPLLASSDDRLARSLASGKVNKVLVVHIALRSRKYDEYTRLFLAQHPDGVVVNIGCGMDTRFYRIDNGQVIFFDLDLPEIIQFKRSFVAESDRYSLIACSVLDDRWMEQVAQAGPRPTLFLAEGVLMYLDPDPVKALILKLQFHFPGSELVCEVVNSLWLSKTFKPMVNRKMQRGAGLGKEAEFHFGIPGSRELESWGPGIEFLDEWSYFDSNHPRLGWIGWFKRFELFRKTQWTIHYRLN
jgi:methyltransferase (TIGR00027 family)